MLRLVIFFEVFEIFRLERLVTFGKKTYSPYIVGCKRYRVALSVRDGDVVPTKYMLLLLSHAIDRISI